jgi:hypothetical protein
MADFITAINTHQTLSIEAQKQAGKAAGDDMDEQHKTFLAKLIAMIDAKEIDVRVPQSFLNQAVYDSLDELSRGKIDLSLINMADQVRGIEWFFRSKTTPNASPELQTMIEHLWQMKSRVEIQYGDVLKF